MEEKINIAEILKDRPKGLNLYSPVYGKVKFEEVHKDKIYFYHNMNEHSVKSNGKSFDDGEVVIFPSQEMRDWSKFAWKKGDILVNKDAEVHIIFDGFEDDTYKNFHGQYYLCEEWGSIVSFEEDENYMQTSDFNKANKEDAQEYIHKIEKELGCKFNMETLEIEKPQPEFKDGDIAFADFGKTQDVFIVSGKTNLSEGYYSFIVLNLNSTKALSIGYKTSFFKENLNTLRLATEEEKQQLFDALAKEGKALPDMKKMRDLLKKCEFKPIDWCLMRGGKEHFVSDWTLCQFSHKMECGKYRAVGGCAYDECIPYNDQTKHLLGTTDEWKGGEGEKMVTESD